METQQNGQSGNQSNKTIVGTVTSKHQNEFEFSAKTLTIYIIPLESCGAFLLLSIQTLDPKLASMIFFEFDLTAILLTNSILGMSLFLVNSINLRRFHVSKRIVFSLFGGFVLPFAAMYAWTQLSKLLPDLIYVNGTIGVLTAAAFLKLGHSYIDYIDYLISSHSVYFLV